MNMVNPADTVDWSSVPIVADDCNQIGIPLIEALTPKSSASRGVDNHNSPFPEVRLTESPTQQPFKSILTDYRPIRVALYGNNGHLRLIFGAGLQLL